MAYTYILKCADGTFYIGSTRNLEKRVWDHQNRQGGKYTRKRLPVELVYCEEHQHIGEAYQREKQIQGWSHKKKQALISGDLNQLIDFSKNKKIIKALALRQAY
ncbi:MAG: putative endonuclease [Chloroflexota bacterium]|nr:putative endonuclease [Chloroflexota bacterium]